MPLVTHHCRLSSTVCQASPAEQIFQRTPGRDVTNTQVQIGYGDGDDDGDGTVAVYGADADVGESAGTEVQVCMCVVCTCRRHYCYLRVQQMK
jgi:hypothetical protein